MEPVQFELTNHTHTVPVLGGLRKAYSNRTKEMIHYVTVSPPVTTERQCKAYIKTIMDLLCKAHIKTQLSLCSIYIVKQPEYKDTIKT